jgi:ABC-type multidrug transport system ATPase subunit
MGEPALRAHNIGKSFGRHHVLRSISFAVEPGMLVGIVGENGAGKSTLLRILTGDLRPDHGEVFIRGVAGYCPQTAVLNEELTVAQHFDYFRAAYAIATCQRAEELVSMLHYEQYRTARVGTLSGGTRQKLNLTLALMHEPDVLLLDEPYQGFDWETYLRFWELATELRAHGCALVIISHMFFEQQRFDRLFRLREGEIAAVAVPEHREGEVR